MIKILTGLFCAAVAILNNYFVSAYIRWDLSVWSGMSDWSESDRGSWLYMVGVVGIVGFLMGVGLLSGKVEAYIKRSDRQLGKSSPR